MARVKRTNFARVKIWMEHMTADVEGTIGGVALETFAAIESPVTRGKVLEMIHKRHATLLEREAGITPSTCTTSATSA